MIDIWHNLKPDSVFKKWDTGYFDGLFRRSGIFNNSHFLEYIKDFISDKKEILWKLSVGAFDLNSAKFFRYDESIGYDNLLIATKASGSMPFVFETVNFDGKTLTDGGLFMNLDVPAAVSRCLEQVSSHWEITIDIVLTNEYKFDNGDYSESTSLPIAWRAYHAW